MSAKKLKRFLSVALSLSMVLSLNTTNFASEAIPDSTGTQIEADTDTHAEEPTGQHAEDAPEAEAEAPATDATENPEEDPAAETDAEETQEPAAEADGNEVQEPAAEDEVSVGEDTQEEVFSAQTADTAPQAGDTTEPTPPAEPEKDPTKCDGENHVYAVSVVKAATCTTSGMGKKTCQCKKNSSFVSLQPRHTYQKIGEDKNPVLGEDGKIVVDEAASKLVRATATCTSSGLVTYKCTKCTQTYNVTTAPLKHTFEREEGWPETKPTPDDTDNPTCGGTPGKKVWTCKEKDCGYSYEETIAPTGKHNYVDEVIAETCTTPRCTLSICSQCKEVEEGAEPIPITGENARRRYGHSFEATTDGGLLLKDDISDGILEVSSKVQPIDSKEATCLVDGYKTYECTGDHGCGFKYTKVIKARGSHEEKEIPDFIPPTCTENAKYITRCKYCDKPVGEETDALDLYLELNGGDEEAAIAAAKDAGAYQLGHIWGTEKPEVEGSCTTSGISTFTCTRCLAEEMREVPARHDFEDENHNLKPGLTENDTNNLVIFKEATCTETGIAYCTCTKCGTRRTDIVIPATGHDYGIVTDTYENYTEDTDDGVLKQDFVCHDGQAVYTCKNNPCDHSYSVDIPAKPHKPADIVTTKPATCTEPLTQAVFCTVCQDPTSDAKVVGPKLGHTYEVIGEDGEVQVDENGDIVINKETAGTPATVDASCTEEGSVTYTCTKCREKHVITIPKEPHNADQVDIIEPTCKANAKIKETCTSCNEYFVIKDVTEVYTDEEITAMDLWQRNGHEWKLEAVFNAPTCTTNGIALYQCGLCGDTENRTLNAHHSYTDDEGVLIPADEYPADQIKIAKPADCENNGIAIYTCKDCQAGTEGHTFEGTIEKLGHQFDDGTPVPNDKECQPGKIVYTCQREIGGVKCGKTQEEPLPETAKAHIYEEKEIPATCVDPGKKGKFCKWCNEIQPGTTPVVIEGSDPKGHSYIGTEENGRALTDAEGNTVYVKADADLTADTDYIVVKAEKCEETGSRTYKCSNDGCSNEITLTVPGLEHSWSIWKVEKANCTDPARKERTCSLCDEKDKQFVTGSKPVEGDDAHSWVRDEGQDDVLCGEVKFTCEYNPAHTKTEEVHDWDEGNATTTTSGNFKIINCKNEKCEATKIDSSAATDGYVYCDTCKDGVQPEAFGAFPPTCEKTGKTDKEICQSCAKVFKEAQDIAATGHEYIRKVVQEATCVDGYSEEVCKNDKTHTRNRVVIPATGEVPHQFEDVEGKDYRECSECHTKDVIAATRIEAGVENGMNIIRLIADAQLVDDGKYEILQRGILYYTAAEGYPGRLVMEDVGNVPNLKMKEIKDAGAIGARVPINIGTATTRVIYARSYVVLRDKETKDISHRYGEVVSGSFESLGGR